MTLPFAAPLIALATLSLLAACSSGDGASGEPPPDARVSDLACSEYAPPGSLVTPVKTGLLCTLLGGTVCEVNAPNQAIDRNPQTHSGVIYRLGLLDILLGGAAGLQVTLPGPVPAGRLAAVDLDLGLGLLDAALGRTVTITTLRNGERQESRGTGTLLSLEILGRPVASDAGRGLVGFVNQLPYDELRVTLNAALLAVELSGGARVFEVCLNGRPAD